MAEDNLRTYLRTYASGIQKIDLGKCNIPIKCDIATAAGRKQQNSKNIRLLDSKHCSTLAKVISDTGLILEGDPWVVLDREDGMHGYNIMI